MGITSEVIEALATLRLRRENGINLGCAIDILEESGFLSQYGPESR